MKLSHVGLAAVLVAAACDVPPPPKPAPAAPVAPAVAAPAKSCSFEGRVLSDLDEEVNVTLAEVDQMPPCWDGPRDKMQRFAATVAPGETFRFEGVRPGTFWISAESATSAQFDYHQVNVPSDVRGYEIHVRRACRLLGHVVFGKGIDPRDVWVRYDIPTGGFELGRGLAPSGRFEVGRLEPGEVGVLVRHWPDRGPDGAEPALRVETYVKATLVPGDNDVEIKIDADSPHVR